MRISDVKVTNAKQAIYANAFTEKPIRNVLFENVWIEAEKGGSINNGKDWEMKNVTLRSEEQIKLKNCNNVQLPANSKWDDTTQKDCPDQCREVGIPSSLDGEAQMAYFYASEKKDRPLVVSLHTWSGNYEQKDELAIQCIEKDYNYIHPDFRGPNNTFKACGSKYVIQDIKDAISFAIENGNVDVKNIHIVGTSGGGYATLLSYMNTKHPVKTFSAWVPISQSLNFFNKVVSDFDSLPGSAFIPQEDIIEMLASRHYAADSKDTLGDRIVHYHMQYKNFVEISVFEGSHECLTKIALEHLQEQKTNRKNSK